ncbi:MAG: YiiX/YebB-like N1pC/P60 family cysteine hydrolase [Patescibacteria group bacterium]|nr:hypothetical protein [Patescibacteria group bacterium]
MILRFLLKNRQALFISVLFLGFFTCQSVKAMPVGTLLYRTSGNGNLYGYNTDQLVVVKNKMLKNIYTGHVAIYIGKENGVDYIIEAMPRGLIKVPANRFINTKNGEELVGAKIPKNISEIQRLKVVQIAKTLAEQNLSYDFDFKKQKGPSSGEWTCVGLTEKIYESANISNPFNLSSLEYDPRFYAVNITPDGFDNYSVQNKNNGDCLSRDYEFSKISANKETLVPFPELIGFNSGYEYDGERYFFFPLTQFWQENLDDVEVDIELSSNFSDEEVRGNVPEVAMVFKWSLINNPLSSVNKIFDKIAAIFRNDKSEYISFNDKNSEVIDDFDTRISDDFSLDGDDLLVESKPPSEDIKINKLSSDNQGDLSLLKKLKSLISIDSSLASFNTSTDVFSSKINSEESSVLNSNVLESEVNNNQAEVFLSSIENFDILKKNLLISRVHATLSDDYVEIYNPNNVDIDLEEAGVRLYKAKTSLTPSLMMRIGNLSDGSYPKGVIIPAKGKYVIARSSASEEIKNKAHAIASRAEFSFTGKTYTIYLSGGVVSSDEDEDVVDKIGFGGAKYFERFPALEILDNHLLVRKAKIDSTSSSMKEDGADFNLGNSYDSHNNLFDFVLINLTSVENQNNNQTENNNSNNTNDSNNSNDDTNNDIENTNNSSAENEQQNNNQEDSQAESPLSLLISKIYATGKDDYIELYNPNEVDINLEESSYRLYKTKTGTSPYLMLRFGNLSDASYPGGLIISAKGKYLIARSDASAEILNKAQAIVNRSEFTYTGDAYTIYLSTGVVSSDNDEDIVDKVGYGNATYYQILPSLEILNNHLLIRKAQADSTAILMAENCEHFFLGNGFNSKNNSFDFVLLDLSKLQGNYCNNQDQEDDNSGDDQENDQDELNNYAYNYCLDEALAVDDVINLWHFNECQGDLAYDFAGNNNIDNLNISWLMEENNCSISHHQSQNSINTKISELFDSNNFTLLFKYKLPYLNSRPNVKFFNSSNDSYFQIQFYRSYSEFRGLPNVPQRLDDLKWPVGDKWHQFALVVDKSSDYWALYNDGVEVLKKDIGPNFISEVDSLALVATGNETIFDEISIFKRPLKPSEISNFHQKNLQLNSLDCQNRRFKKPQQVSYFNFDDNYFQESENDKIIIYDLNESDFNSELEVSKSSLLQDRNNFYLNINSGEEFFINSSIIKIKEKPDLSLSFWLKRNLTENLLSSFNIKLFSDNKNIFGVNLGDNFFYYFNDLLCQVDEDMSSLGLSDDAWHNIVLVYDYYKFELNLYVDGSLKKKINKNWLDYNMIDKIIISSEGNSSYLDEMNLWLGILDGFDINFLYLNKKSLFE